MIFPDLLANETIYWHGFSNAITGKTVTFTPRNPGILSITSKINGKGVTKNIQVIQVVINNIIFTDSQGNKIEKASWGQDINLWVEHSGLDGENLNIVLWDDDLGPTDDPVKTIAINSYNGRLIPVTLDPSMKGKTVNHGEIFIKVSAPELIAIGEGKDFPTSYKLDVEDVREIYSAIIGSADGKEKHTLVDYDEVSYFYAHTRGIKSTENLYLEIPKAVFGSDPVLLEAKNVKVDNSGVITEKIVWNNIKNKVNLLTVYGIVKQKDADGNLGMAATKLQKGSSLAKQAGYAGAVKVGSDVITQQTNGTCACQQYNLVWGEHQNVSCEYRKKVVEISKRQNFDPNDLMSIMKVETPGTFSPSKIEIKPTKEKRKNGTFKRDYRGLTKEEIMQLSENFAGAVGLIQFTPVAISSLNKNYNLSLTKRQLL